MRPVAHWLADGILRVHDEPHLLLACDYPYYRDDARNWPDRLDALRDSGFGIVSAYVPWRHHQPRADITPDFSGKSQANRDVLGFLQLARERGLRAILKPGPFVHGELAFGGLPDFVDPARDPLIEPERNAFGDALAWPHGEVMPHRRRALPAPFDPQYCRLVRSWLGAFAREVLLPNVERNGGPVIALQLMNEGIYSDSSLAEPQQLGYAHSTLRRYHEFLRERYGDLERYNALHRRGARAWSDVRPPLRAEVLVELRDLLEYVDWSEFQSRLYVMAAREYRAALLEAGLPSDFEMIFNFNPNGDTFRTRPASNDGWYTRVNFGGDSEFTFGSTNWLGVLTNDESAFRQYVMAVTAFRGPAMEQNWGFSTQYFAPYEHVTPSHFESMLGIACGATGATIYTLVGTRAWREDANLADDIVPQRTNDRDDASAGDYPGSAAVPSTGERRPKFWTIRQMAQYLASEGPRFVLHGPQARVAWAIYPPYAWVGQWLPRGDPDDTLWRPPLRVIPRGAYHGLDSFVEMMTRLGSGFRQIDISRADKPLAPLRAICLSGHDMMDADTQERLARYVEQGGTLLLTNVVPRLDLALRPMRGALATRLYPHEVTGQRLFEEPAPIRFEDELVGRAEDFAITVRPPADARPIVRVDDAVVGYERRVGRGRAVYVGLGPWRARLSGDDALVAREDQELIARLLRAVAGDDLLVARPIGAPPGEVIVWSHGDPARDEQHVFVVVREASGEIEVEFERPAAGGSRARDRLVISSPSQSVHAISVQEGKLRACYLKGVNDVRGERIAPSVRLRDETWSAEDACDLCVTPAGVTVAHLGAGKRTRVRLGARSIVVADSRDDPEPASVTSRGAGAEAGTGRSRGTPRSRP